jgi:hypothetical protein
MTENLVFSFKWFVGQQLDLAYWWAASALRIRKILGKMLARDFANLFVGEVLLRLFCLVLGATQLKALRQRSSLI